MKVLNRIGETTTNKKGQTMKIINYRSATDIDILFDNGSILYNKTYSDFKRHNIKNLTYPTICGVGVIGYGKYEVTDEKGKTTKLFEIWSSMIKRCYSDYKLNHTSYGDCFVSEEWLYFQNFCKWYEENKWTNDIELSPDKDILTHGRNKYYSKETVLLVDQRINNLFLKGANKKRNNLIGVTYIKDINKYMARCGCHNKRKTLGVFKTEIEAFRVYKDFKESYIKQVADEYFNEYPHFPYKLLQAMYEYRVDIND